MYRIALLLVLSVGAWTSDAKRVRSGGVKLGANPGAVVKIKRAGFDALFENLCELGSKYARKLPLPNVAATFGGVDLEIKEARVAEFQKMRTTYRFVAPNCIVGKVMQPAVSFDAPFNATRRTFIKTQRDAGRVNLKFNDVGFEFEACFGEFETGVPYIKDFKCSATMGPANMNIKDCKESYSKETLGLAAKSIRPLYTTQVCEQAKKMIEKNLNKLLSRCPNVIEFNENCALKFQLKPTVDEDSFQFAFHSKVLTEEVSAFQPAPCPSVNEEDAMVVIKISDAPANDIAYQAFVNDKLNCRVHPKSPPIIYSLLSLKCAENEACLGNVAPTLALKYGQDALVEAKFRATGPPQIDFVENKAAFKAALAMDLTITTVNDSKSYHEATASIDISGYLQIRIVKGVLYAQIVIENIKVRIDEEHNQKWQDKIQDCIKKVIQESVNGGILLKGVPLKLPFGCGVTEPEIKIFKGWIVVKTGFEYKAQTSSEEAADNGNGGHSGGRGHGGRSHGRN